ncbi:hypothetical protein FHR75_003711 [Kineococcus radiotolerans]|uniref:DUF6458 domain-containing protein n=2 Tax=Kineococcus radiotolerans TaxID=131568 RepID=A0A7W4TQ40_KINRA|nr:hypothetical protein [Kineococcus radiotolerans]
MRMGNSCCLLTIGAILAFAVHVEVEVVDVAMVGRILMLVAVAGALVELAVVRPRARAARAAAEQRPAPARPAPRAPQASWSPWDTRAFTPLPRSDRES